MGNYTTSPLVLSPTQRNISINFALHPIEAAHRLDSEYDQNFLVKDNFPDFVKYVNEFDRKVSIQEDGKLGYFSFEINFVDALSDGLEGELQIEFCLKVLQTAEMVGAPGMIRNTVTVPIRFENVPANDEVTFDLDCRFN